MKVKQLIKALKRMPAKADVWHLWDGCARTEIEHVWLAKNGMVITADIDMSCYPTDHRPVSAPTAEEDGYWRTPEEPMKDL